MNGKIIVIEGLDGTGKTTQFPTAVLLHFPIISHTAEKL